MLEEEDKCDDVNKIWERVKEGLLKAASEGCCWTKDQSKHQHTLEEGE